jgi:hypothetical protein
MQSFFADGRSPSRRLRNFNISSLRFLHAI